MQSPHSGGHRNISDKHHKVLRQPRPENHNESCSQPAHRSNQNYTYSKQINARELAAHTTICCCQPVSLTLSSDKCSNKDKAHLGNKSHEVIQ
jgi:hypothetical protein